MEISLSALREKIIKMGSLSEKVLKLSANLTSRTSEVFEIEGRINQFHIEIDELSLNYIALKRPLATDLRTVIAIMKINSDLERIGDQAVNIKRYMSLVGDRIFPQIKTMQEEVTRMLRNSLDAFIHSNTHLATSVIQNDQAVNDLQRSAIHHFFDLSKKGDLDVDLGFQITKIAKNLERIGDLTTNIAEDVIFIVSGNDVRHIPGMKNPSQTDADITQYLKKTTEE